MALNDLGLKPHKFKKAAFYIKNEELGYFLVILYILFERKLNHTHIYVVKVDFTGWMFILIIFNSSANIYILKY